MTTVFLSYAREDKPQAVDIVRALERNGVIVWWDSNLLAGDEFRKTIEEQIDKADYVVVLWTKHSTERTFVPDEASRGHDQKKLIPIRLGKAKIPIGFGETHTIDCDNSLDDLLRAVGVPKGRGTTNLVKDPIRLSKVERLILINQYEIRGLVDPASVADYKNTITALRNGYTDRVRVFDWLYDELEPSIHKDVFDILELYRALTFSYQDVKEKKGISKSRLEFRGFDGNNETAYFGYVQYLLGDEGLYQELHRKGGYNSHWPMMPQYVAMLQKWEELSRKRELSRSEILAILNAKIDERAFDKYLPK